MTFSVAFAPTKSGNVSGKLELLSNASNSTLTLALTGDAVASSGYASVTPLSTPFGEVPVGTKDTQIITVESTGSTSMWVESVTTSAAGFSISGIKTPMSILPGAETYLTVAFLPESRKRKRVHCREIHRADSSVTIAVSGTGMSSSRTLSISPASVASRSGTRAILTLPFPARASKVRGLTEAGMGGAVTLTPGQSATLTVQFSPKSAGAVSLTAARLLEQVTPTAM